MSLAAFGRQLEPHRHRHGMRDVELAVRTLRERVRESKERVIQRRRLVVLVERIHGNHDPRRISDLAVLHEQQWGRTLADQLPVGVRQQGSLDEVVVESILRH